MTVRTIVKAVICFKLLLSWKPMTRQLFHLEVTVFCLLKYFKYWYLLFSYRHDPDLSWNCSSREFPSMITDFELIMWLPTRILIVFLFLRWVTKTASVFCSARSSWTITSHRRGLIIEACDSPAATVCCLGPSFVLYQSVFSKRRL